jgi:hypothetical protein
MESMDRERWSRLLDAVAVRNVDVDAPDAGRGAVPIAVRRARSREGGTWAWLATRGRGALAVLAVGAVHLQQYLWLYSAIPTIGTLFVLNFAGATAIGLGLLAPLERVLGRRWGSAAVGLLAAGRRRTRCTEPRPRCADI